MGLVAAAVATVLAACTSSSPAGSGPPHRTGGTTTTTLPSPILVDGTAAAGSLAFLGSVMRVTVPLLPVGFPAAGASGTTGPSATDPAAGAQFARTTTVAFRQFGAGPDVVLVMGQSGSMSWWDPTLLESLQAHYRVTIFDLPGIGWSGAAPGFTASVEDYSDATAGLLEALGLKRPVLVGWGMGGEVGTEVAVRHPGSVSKLVLVDTSAGGPAATPTPRAVASALGSSGTTPSGIASLLFPPSDSTDRATWLTGMLQDGPDDVVASALAAEAAAQQAWWSTGVTGGDLSAISVPTMVVWGSADGVFPPQDGGVLATDIPGARAVPLAGAGYASLFEPTEPFVTDLVGFTGS